MHNSTRRATNFLFANQPFFQYMWFLVLPSLHLHISPRTRLICGNSQRYIVASSTTHNISLRAGSSPGDSYTCTRLYVRIRQLSCVLPAESPISTQFCAPSSLHWISQAAASRDFAAFRTLSSSTSSIKNLLFEYNGVLKTSF